MRFASRTTPLRGAQRTPGRRAGSQSGSGLGLSGTTASGRGKGDDMFSGSSRGVGGKSSHSAFASAQLNFWRSFHCIAFFPLATKQTDALYFHHLTHIQNRFLVGCCSRNQVQVFDPAPDRQVKGCRSCLAVPRQQSSVEPGRQNSFFLFLFDSFFSFCFTRCWQLLVALPERN